MIDTLLDIEKDFRECDGLLASGGRHLNCVRNESYFDLMEEYGFVVSNKFLSIHDIFQIVSKYNVTQRTLMLEAAACDLSFIYNATYGANYDETN